MAWARGKRGAAGVGAGCRFRRSQPGVIVVVVVAPSAVTSEVDVTVTGGGVIVQVAVEAIDGVIVLWKG